MGIGLQRVGSAAVFALIGCGEPGSPAHPVASTSTGSGSSGVTGDQGSSSGGEADDDHRGTTSGSDDGAGVIFDVFGAPDVAPLGCEGEGELSFSYIWIANSDEGTLSKIDTQSLVEVGRYLVSPGGSGLPSRTSVNLSGDVAVANRTGGITKVYADTCPDTNGILGIQTSSGPDDVLPWAEDECIAWHTPMTYGSQRPIAWTQGTYDPESCTWGGQKVWTTGTTMSGDADVILLNGDDGTIERMVTVRDLSPNNAYGGYGAVVDHEGNLWFNEMYMFGDALVRVSIDDLAYEVIPTHGRSGYGIAIDESGHIWTCGGYAVHRYDPVARIWASAKIENFDLGGCMVDGEHRLWVSGSNTAPFTFKAFDTESLLEVASFAVPEHLHGVSIDFDGYVWGVAGIPAVGAGERAYRLDPDTGAYDTVEGLVGAYTYSDMTGFALAGATQLTPG